MIDRLAGVLALAVSATVLAGCGGGGPPAATDAAPSVVDASGTVGASDVRPLAFSLPQAYRRRGPSYNWGCASCESFEPGGDGSRGRLLTLDGEFKVNSSFPNTPAPASSITFYGITPNGTAIGWNSDERRGFVQFGSTGQTQLLPAHANPRFVAESGIVGGSVCLPDGSDCHAFHWSPSAPVLAEHPLFQAAWMNNTGRMVGHYQPPGRASQLATVDPDGTITPLGFDAGPGLSAWPRYIADDGPVFLNVIREGDGNLDAVVVANGTATRVGRGIVARPDICGICDCVERTFFTAFSATGHAVGVDHLEYPGPDGSTLVVEAGFHWSARDGATAVEVDARTAIPTGVNAQGAVVGLMADNQEPFLWHRDARGVRLNPLLVDREIIPIQHIDIGDGGHLLIHDQDPFHADGSGMAGWAPVPAAAAPGG